MMKKIEGWEGYYMTEEGRVFSTYKGVLKESISRLITSKTWGFI